MTHREFSMLTLRYIHTNTCTYSIHYNIGCKYCALEVVGAVATMGGMMVGTGMQRGGLVVDEEKKTVLGILLRYKLRFRLIGTSISGQTSNDSVERWTGRGIINLRINFNVYEEVRDRGRE